MPPHSSSSYSYELDYGPGAPVQAATVSWAGDAGDFLARVAPARTFSLAREVEQMHALGLFTGFTPADLLVIGDDGNAIDNELHSADEPALHKLLDLIGDLALATGGRPLHAKVAAVRTGHRMHHDAARAIAAQLA